MWVTANLYVPQTGRPPYPAVLHSTGHSQSAKNRSFYRTLSIGLVKHGFVVLTYDPLGQGNAASSSTRTCAARRRAGPPSSTRW